MCHFQRTMFSTNVLIAQEKQSIQYQSLFYIKVDTFTLQATKKSMFQWLWPPHIFN